MAVRLDRNYEPLPGYRLIDRLGRGGFGEVWKVEAPGQLMKAMKFVFGNLDTHDEDEGRPAEQELKALNRVKTIRHPYILSLERIDIVDGQLIIVMELADKNLWDRFRECRVQKLPGIPREELLQFLGEAAEALDLMNDEYHIQHLDVKPQNLFVLHHHVKVADFGLAKAFEGGRGTITGGVTPVYAAPETFEGYASRYTDQYSLAIVFQELLTGTRPFNGSNTKQLLMQHLNGVPDLSSLPANDKSIIGRALNKKPDDRWPSCSAMVQALRQAGLNDTPLPLAPLAFDPTAPLTDRSLTPAHSPPLSGTRSGYRHADVTETQKTKVKTVDQNIFSRPQMPQRGVSTSTGLKLVTPLGAATSSSPNARVLRSNLLSKPLNDTTLTAVRKAAPTEITDTGVFFPALLVGVGRHGLLVLQRLRKMLKSEFGSLDAVPHLRFLYIDTDPDEIAAAVAQDNENKLSPHETILTRLNRPTYYTQREGLPPLDQWMPQGLLYKLPREPKNTSGIRSYGRLALFDHYRVISAKIRSELQEIATDQALKTAAEQTGRGVRSNRPRAYIISSTTGGTGSGMTLDLAYLLKNEFRRSGYLKPVINSYLLVPPADKTKPKSVALANTFAMLGEINHFSSEGCVYHTKFDSNEHAISDGDGPFTRCMAIQLPDSATSTKLPRTIGLVARGLWMNLVTEVGRVTDNVRDEALALPRNTGPVIQTYGLFRYTWPRRDLLESLTRRFSALLLTRWAGKDVAHLRDPIRNWLNEQWGKRELELEQVVEKFDRSIETALREKPDRVFDAFVEPLRVRLLGGGRIDENTICDVLEELLKLVGHPNPESDNPGKLEETLRQTGKLLAIESEGHLSALAVSFIEQPQYRLAGADEAISQFSEKLKQTIETLDNIRKGLLKDVFEIYQKLYTVIQTLTKQGTGLFGGRRTGQISDLCELMRRYPRVRLKLSILESSAAFYRGLLGQCPDYGREIATVRTRLTEIASKMNVETAGPGKAPDEPAMIILPPGCLSLNEASDEFLNALSPEEILEFEQTLQHQTARKFRGIVNVCVKPELTDDFLTMMTKKAGEFIDPRIERADAAAVFFRYKENQPNTAQELEEAFDEAAPDLTTISGAAPAEATILAAPPGENGERLRQFVSGQLEGVEFIPAPLDSDLILYREYPLLEIVTLPQLAEHAREAYAARLGTEHPPHARTDVRWEAPRSEP